MPSEPFIGEICLFASNFAPRNWAFCDGQLLSIASNTALFSLLGTIYGGNGRTDFALPDLRGRLAIHPGNGPGLSSYSLGQKTGVENVTLSQAQMPSHTHAATTTVTANASPTEGDSTDPTGRVWAKSGQGDPDFDTFNAAVNVQMDPSATSASTVVGNTGSNSSHTNIQPVLGLHYIIALQGIFPSRS